MKSPRLAASLAALALLVAPTAWAQAPQVAEQPKLAEKKPNEPGPWKYTATTGLTLAQSSFTDNWAGGDKGSINWVLSADLNAERQFSRRFNLSNLLQVAYGQTARQVSDSGHPGELVWDKPDKTNDLLLFESTGRFTLESFVDPYGSFRAESQFQDLSYEPYGMIQFNPVKLKEAAGVAKVIAKADDRELISRLGAGFRQTLGRSIVDVNGSTTSFTANDGGLEWQTNVTWPLLENKVQYKAALLVFQPVFYSKSDALKQFDDAIRAVDPTREAVAEFWKATDVNFQNAFTSKITRYLSVNLFAQLIYDKFDTAANVDPSQPLPNQAVEVYKNVRKAGQFKEVLALALTYKLF